MTVNSRSKGKVSENAVCRWLTASGWQTKRRLSGNGQAGDLIVEAAPHVVIDVKDRAVPVVYDWLGQLEAEAAGRPCQALLWKPWSKGPDPAKWLAFVANHPLDWFRREVARPRDAFDNLGTPELRSILGWFDVMHLPYGMDPPPPALFWDSIEHGEFLLMRASTFVEEVLPCWEGLA